MLLIVPFPPRAPGASCGSQVCTDFIAIPPRAPGASSPPPDMLLIVPFPPRAPGAFCGSQVCTDFIAFPPARRARSYSVKSMDGRARCHTCRGAGAGREPGRGQAAGARIGGRPAARCPSTEAHAPPIWKEPVCLLHSILRQGPQSTAIRPLRRRTKHPRRVKNPDQPHDSRPCSITPPRAAAKKSDQPPPCRHPSVDVSAHPSPWQGDQAAGASRGRRQPSGQRPRCPSARLPVPRIAGAIAAAHTIWREGGAPRAGRTEFPPRIARRRKRAGGAQTPEIGACKSARRVVE